MFLQVNAGLDLYFRIMHCRVESFQRESGPRIIRFSDDGKFAYILFELSNEIKSYKTAQEKHTDSGLSDSSADGIGKLIV